MTEKSHVSLEQHVCVVCTMRYETGAILIDRRLRDSLDRHTVTGWGLCPEHRTLFEDGYIALVECNPDRSGNPSPGDLVKSDKAHRTGKVAHLKRDVFNGLFNVPRDDKLPCIFVEPGVIEQVQALAEESNSPDDPRIR